MGLVYGPLGSWLTGLFPVRVRYTGASVAFNAGGILGGAMAPIVAQALAERGGTETVGFYLALAGVVSWLGPLMVRRHGFRSDEIGRASCRARVCSYGLISVVAVSLNRQQKFKNVCIKRTNGMYK